MVANRLVKISTGTAETKRARRHLEKRPRTPHLVAIAPPSSRNGASDNVGTFPVWYSALPPQASSWVGFSPFNTENFWISAKPPQKPHFKLHF